MAGLALARPNFRRTCCDVFDVDPPLFDECCVSDVGCEPVGEFGPDVSLLPLYGHAVDDVWVLECLEGF